MQINTILRFHHVPWSKRKTHPLLVGVYPCKAIVETIVVVLKEDGNRFASIASFTILGHKLKTYSILSQRHLLNHDLFVAVPFIISNNWKQPR